MADSQPLYLGPRLKRLRRELGLTQLAMAEDLDISPSYVALLERNQRPLTVPLLLRLARTYKLDVADLAADDGSDYARRLVEVLRDPIFADIDMPPLEVADAAANFPGISEALLRVHGAYRREQAVLAERRVGGEADGGLDPVGEARRFVASQRNYFHDIDIRAEELAAELAEKGGAEAWLKSRGTRVRFLPHDVMGGALRRYDRHNEQLLIDETLPRPTRAYQLAVHVAYTALRAQINAVVRGADLSSDTARVLVRRALAGYGAAAMLMPYAAFASAVEAQRYDVEILSRLFDTSFEQTAHRLTTLSRPGMERVPFFFIRVDAAGNVSKRLDGAGFPFAAHAGGCPLWTVHSVFRMPDEVVTQWLELPGGERFFSIARTVTAGGGGHGRPRMLRAIALACAAEDAPELVYAQGIDPARVVPTPIGVTCSLCHRAQCTARAVPPIGRDILPDDYRRDAEPFAFSES
jgi:predicted transcriptional regulator/transcriptional regulator with XRE-family HTH domain